MNKKEILMEILRVCRELDAMAREGRKEGVSDSLCYEMDRTSERLRLVMMKEDGITIEVQ